ncbi:hypothetical protein AB4369_20330 [Vibrio sp. 10N.261.49.A5]|uniref:hypothetical protein n=1 Tax=Vibrio sp. 10N.261.49.A5 TaxID=3229670 RepID=UPI003551E6D3
MSQLIQYLKASNTGEDDNFGSSVSLSADGTALAVGALSEDSDGVGGKDNDDARDSGAVYLFRFTGGVWAQEAYLKASNVGVNDQFGSSVSLSADGDTLAVGAPSEDSDGVGGEGDDSFPDSGAVYLFRFTGGVWAQEAYLKASNAGKGDEFGSSVSLSADGTALAVGAIYEDSSSMGVGGEDNDDARDSGAVYLFRFTGDVWAEKAYLKASNAGKDDLFGTSVSLSADGTALAVGAPYEGSSSMGVGGEDNDDARESGAVYLFRFTGDVWAEKAYLKASNAGEGDEFGSSVSLSADGTALAVGALNEDSDGVGGEGDDSFSESGAVYLFRFTGGVWAQEAYLKASNAEGGDYFGSSVSLSADGTALAVGAYYEFSSGMGVNSGSQADNSVYYSGAVYLFRFTGGVWIQETYLKASNTDEFDFFGSSASLSADGDTLAVGALSEDSDGVGGKDNDDARDSGAVYVY